MISPLLILPLAFFAGVAVATGFASSGVELAALALVAATGTLFAIRSEGRSQLLLAATASLLFALGLMGAADGPIELGSVVSFAGREVTVDGVVESDPADINAGGVVLRLRHGTVALLLTADIPTEQELALARSPWELRGHALKLAHHGSETSTTDLLLRRTAPGVVVVSVGEGNPFGHPHEEVLERAGSTILLRTDEDGRVRLRSDGETLRYSTKR